MRTPFSEPPSLGKFLRRLQEFNVSCHETPPVTDPEGHTLRFRYVVRGNHPPYPLPTHLKDEDIVEPHVIRSVCRAMGLPPSIFELDPKEDFGIDDDDDDDD